MRVSHRQVILDAALELLAAAAGGDITLDAVARQAGVTKPGLMYHFPSRRALLLGVVEHVAERIEADLLRSLGKAFSESTPADRIRAYLRVAANGEATRGEYAVVAEASYRPELAKPWEDRMARWFDIPSGTPAAVRARLTAVRLAADGLWSADATRTFPPAPHDRDAVLALLDSLIPEFREAAP